MSILRRFAVCAIAPLVLGCSRNEPAPPPAVARLDTLVIANEPREPISVCVLEGRRLVEVAAGYDPVTRDTFVAGRPFREAYPVEPPYLAAAEWYTPYAMLEFGRRRFVRYGLPRVMTPDTLVFVGEYRGVPLFAFADEPADTRWVMAPMRPGCIFQHYQDGATVGAVRG